MEDFGLDGTRPYLSLSLFLSFVFALSWGEGERKKRKRWEDKARQANQATRCDLIPLGGGVPVWYNCSWELFPFFLFKKAKKD